jgi:hypothetical protein
MRGLALATLFLGLCLINPSFYTDPSVLFTIRSVIFRRRRAAGSATSVAKTARALKAKVGASLPI